MYKIVFFIKREEEKSIQNTWTSFYTYGEALAYVREYDFAIPFEWEWEIMKE